MVTRIKNDIVIRWAIWTDKDKTQPEDFTDAEVSVHVVHARTGDREKQAISIEDNVISLQYVAKDQHRLGVYDLTLTYTKANGAIEGGVATYTRDFCGAFELVGKTCEVYDREDIDIVTIVEKGDKGDPFTYDDFTSDQIDELQRPATEAGEYAREQGDYAKEQGEEAETKAMLAGEQAAIANTAASEALLAAVEARAKVVELETTEGVIQAAENLRQLNEEERKTAEQERQTDTGAAISQINTWLSNADGILAAKANHGYDAEETPKTLKQVETEKSAELDQLSGEVGLLDAVQGAKIKDIENVLSSANLGQSAQVSVSGVSPLSLPKNAANGGMEVKLEGLTAENLMTNGDFRNGLTNWGNANLVMDGEFAKSAGGGYRNIPVLANVKYYISVKYKSDGIGRRQLALRNLGTNVATPAWITTKTNTTISVDSVVCQTTSAGERLSIIDNSAGTVWFSYIILINLTATFGAGNEPTVEECDAIFGEYFEGVKSFEPTGRVRSVDKNGLNPTALYLTAPELRSNGTVKDEIRKGDNGYELVKRVGYGSLIFVKEYNFEDTYPPLFCNPNGTGATFSYNNNSPISGVQDARLIIGTPLSGARPLFYINNWLPTIAKSFYKISFDYKVNSGVCRILTVNLGGGGTYVNISPSILEGSGTFSAILQANQTRTSYLGFTFDGGNQFDMQMDNLKVEKIDDAGGVPFPDGEALPFGNKYHYTLETPEVTPISYGGVLNSAENGTVYHEPIIADAGVYDTNMPILLTDYPISSIEEIIKHEGGVDTYLNASTAVIAPDGLSFTHPDLADGDLVLFTYSFDKETTNGNITATFYDSNVVKIDTVTGKAYKITDVITNGVLTRTLTEV